MGKITKIEWATASWNCFIGCSKVSPACDNCYAERWAHQYKRDFNKVVRAHSTTFNSPKTWARPERIFVCSLSDFFHPDILRADRHAAIHVMRDAPQHTYMLLTKRPENIKPMLLGTAWGDKLPDNVWVGVTAENQEQADKRIPVLLQVPARVRFVSCEPLLGPVDLSKYLVPRGTSLIANMIHPEKSIFIPALNWVIAGGESGAKARPSHPEWFRKLRDDCVAKSVAFMFKQWGEWSALEMPWAQEEISPLRKGQQWLNIDGGQGFHGAGVYRMDRTGKAVSGRYLDGREHNGMPG